MTRTRTESDGRAEIIASIAEHLRRRYVFAPVGSRAADALEASHDRWTSLPGNQPWAAAVTEFLRAETHDPHLKLVATPSRTPSEQPRDEIAEAEPEDGYASMNFGFRKVEILRGNVGLLAIDSLLPPEQAASTGRAALDFVAHTRGLVLDLRRNRGGTSAMVAWLASHVLPPSTELCSLHDRSEPQPWSCITHAVIGPMFDTPLTVLVGRQTASAAESLAYDLRRLGRALTVGAPTQGAAHAIESYRIHPRFRLVLPYAQALDPHGNNWHRDGVPLDVACDEADATARALEHLASHPT